MPVVTLRAGLTIGYGAETAPRFTQRLSSPSVYESTQVLHLQALHPKTKLGDDLPAYPSQKRREKPDCCELDEVTTSSYIPIAHAESFLLLEYIFID